MRLTAFARLGAAVFGLLLVTAFLAAVNQPANAAKTTKTTICHSTMNQAHPYETITISNNALPAHAKHHGGADLIPAPAQGCPGPVVDVCPNIAGVQGAPPPGYVIDGAGDCVPIVITPCNTATNAGGQGVTVTNHGLGTTGPTSFQFYYEAYGIPDQFEIRYEGNVIFTTGGLISGGTTVTVNVPAGVSSTVEVTVTGPDPSTAWEYLVSCPSPPV